MKKVLFLTLMVSSFLFSKAQVQFNKAALGYGTTTDNFTYDGKQVGNYSLGWYYDSSNIGAPTYFLSSHGGIKLFTSREPRLTITNTGNVGIGTINPLARFQVDGTYQNRNAAFTYACDPEEEVFFQVKTNMYTSGAPLFLFKDTRADQLRSQKLLQVESALSGTIFSTLANGKIGIGTSSPYEFVSIYKDQAEGTSLSLRNDNTGNSPNAYAGLAFYNGLNSSYIRLNSKNATKDAHCMELITFPSNQANPADIIFKASKNEVMRVKANGTVGIGTTNTNGYKLAVNGTIGAREIVVSTETWADFVFAKNYRLMPLSEVESFITENNHLPDVPSEQEVKENGINVAEMNAKLLQKVEELTLYMIQQNKEKEAMMKRINELEKAIEAIK